MIRRALAGTLMLALLAASTQGLALTAIFYQPQLRDRAIKEAQWPLIFSTAHTQGFDTVVVQWTRYGDAFDDEAGRVWLQARLFEARAAGLQLVLGLAADPEFFSRQEMPAEALPAYFQQLQRNNAALAQYWQQQLPAHAIAGWYLPLEVDDRRWREQEARQTLLHYLHNESRQLGRRNSKPVYLSSFFGGYMSPQAYAELITDMEKTGVHVWVQDGAGTGKLTTSERRHYLEAALDCHSGTAAGVVYELFHQTGTDAVFSATAKPADEAAAVLAQRAPCGKNSVFFSLRYLPALQGTLPVGPSP